MAASTTGAAWIESLVDTKERGSDGKEHWILKTNEKKRDENKRIQVLTIGDENDKKAKVKTVLLLGQTGSGKSLLLNGFVNHIFNIKYDSTFRLKLRDQIVGKPRDQTQSQTDYVTAFLIYHHEGMLYNDYNLMIIDTPGFDDTRGNDIFTNLYDFFMGDFKITCLNCIGLVMKGNENRSLTHQKKLLNDIISLLGKDCSNITRLLCTFAFFGTSVVDVVRDAGISVAGVDRFENFPLCPLLGQNCDANFIDPCALWENMSKGYCKFFESLPSAAAVNVKKTRELFKSLKKLGELKDKLGGIADAMSTLCENGKQHFDKISELKNAFSQQFWDADEIATRYVGEGWHAHNCKKCGQCCLKCPDPSNGLVHISKGLLGLLGLFSSIALISVGGSPLATSVVVPITGYLIGTIPYKTKDDCPNKCSNDRCQHDEDDHEISFEEMVPKWAIGDNVNIEHKCRCQDLKKGILDENEALEKFSNELEEMEKEAKNELQRLISVTENIGKLSSGSDTPTPAKVLEDLENESSGAYCYEVYKSLKGCLSEINGDGEAEKETSNKRNLTQFAQDNKKFKKEW